MFIVYGFGKQRAAQSTETADNIPHARIHAAAMAAKGLLARIYEQRTNRAGDLVEHLIL